MANRSSEIQCRDHPNAILVQDYRAGDLICPECGTVVVERCIDVSSEWRTFSNDAGNDKSRVGDAENNLLSDSGLGTVAQTGIYGSEDGGTDYNKMTTKRGLSSSDRALFDGNREISQMAERINLQKTIVSRAQMLYKQVHDSGQFRGKSRVCVGACCLLIACRQESVPRTFKEICAISNVPKTDLGRTFKKIIKALESSVETIRSGDFMARFCGNLGLPVSVRRAAEYIANRAYELNLVQGRSPISVAAAAIYMASQASTQKRSKEEISETSGVAEATIKQSYKLLIPRASLLFPPDFVFDTVPHELPPL